MYKEVTCFLRLSDLYTIQIKQTKAFAPTAMQPKINQYLSTCLLAFFARPIHGSPAAEIQANEHHVQGMRFNHLGISVSNMSAQVHFYRDAMGFHKVVQNFTLHEPNLIKIIQLQNSQGLIAELIYNAASKRLVNTTDSVDASKYQGFFHWALTVPDLNSTFARLTAAGAGGRAVAAPGPDTFQEGWVYAYVADPEDNLLELMQRVN